MSIKKRFVAAIIGFSALLGGCASNVNVAKQLSAQQSVPPQEGVLVARVINTTGYRLPFNQLFIDPKAVNTSKEVKTVLAYSEDKPVGDSSLFAVTMPVGEYSLAAVRSIIFRGEGYYTRATSSDPEFGTFSVQAGKVTDLGTIIYYAKPQDDVYKDILIRLPESAKGEVLNEYFPTFATIQDNIMTWDADERDDIRFAQYASAVQNPISFADEIVAPDGSIYFLGKLGVMLRYQPDDGFETLAIDSDLQVSSFAQNDAGDRIAGGFEGALYFQANNGDWEAVSIPEQATVHYLSFYQENQFDVVYTIDNELRIARFNNEDLSTSQLLNTYTYAKRWELATEDVTPRDKIPKKPHNIKSVWISQKGDTKILKVNSYKVGSWTPFDATLTESYVFSPDTWEMSLRKDDDESMDAILTAGAAEIGIKQAGFWSWTGMPSYYTRANSSSEWREVSAKIVTCKEGAILNKNGLCIRGKTPEKERSESFTFVSRPWFWDGDNGIAIVNFSSRDFWSGKSSSETSILITSNGGETWEKTELSLPKPYCSNIIGDVTDRILLSCSGATSDFFESTDRGETWQHIRQQQDF